MKNALLILVMILSVFQLSAQATIDGQLSEALNSNPTSLEVIVTFHGDAAPTAADVALLEQVGIAQGLTLNALPIAGVIATPAQINALANRPEVRSLYLNSELEYELDRATVLTGVDKVRTEPVYTAHNGGLPLSGRGIGLLVNDSGVDGTHPDLEYGSNLVENVYAAANLNSYSSILPYTPIEGVINTDATGGHGTHVAGIAGGTGAASQGKYEGVAPGADLIGYGSGAGLFILDVLSAFDYAITHQFQYGIRVVTNSWGTTSQTGVPFNPNDPINVATKKCTDRNIVVVFSAGNSGSASGTITGNYKKAPWVICVASGDKLGRLSDYSSRGSDGVGGTVVVDGQTFVWEDRPTVTAPGEDIISARTVSPIGALGTPDDVNTIDPAHLAYYTTSSGTSMAAPHIAGIVALLLEANPQLTPYQIKSILQATATNMPGRAPWEVGAGYVNAYAAVDAALGNGDRYGSSLNMGRQFVSNLLADVSNDTYIIEYTPPNGPSNTRTINVVEGTTAIEVQMEATGLAGETGNLLNLVLYSPSGARYSAGIPVAFTLYTDRGVAVASPEAGTWTIAVEGYQGVSIPETLEVRVRRSVTQGTTGLNDIDGHPAEASIRLAISNRLMDGRDGNFHPDDNLTRIELADYLMMGQGVKQYRAPSGAVNFSDVSAAQRLMVESVMTKGAAMRDRANNNDALLTSAGSGTFGPNNTINRAELAYTIVQALGLQDYAESLQGGTMTVDANGQTVEIEDAASIPAALRGHVQAALNLNLINAFFYLQQGPYDLTPTLHADFRPAQLISRAEFAVIITRTFEQWQQPTVAARTQAEIVTQSPAVEFSVYPNPTADLLQIQLDENMPNGQGEVLLINMQGQILQRTTPYLEAGTTLQLNLSQYPSGSYILRLATATDQVFTERVTVR